MNAPKHRLRRLLVEVDGALSEQDGAIIELALLRDDAEFLQTALAAFLDQGEPIEKALGLGPARGRPPTNLVGTHSAKMRRAHELRKQNIPWPQIVKEIDWPNGDINSLTTAYARAKPKMALEDFRTALQRLPSPSELQKRRPD